MKKKLFIECGAIAGFKEPTSVKSRYIMEDLPFGLVPGLTLGKIVNINTPLINSELRLSSSINNEDYFGIGRNMNKLSFTLKSLLNTI